MARPRIDIDEAKVYRLAKLGASNVDIGFVVGCSENVIRARFGEVVAKGKAERRNSLRSWQWKAARDGNVTMLIWLGKQMLGQSDKIETKSQVTTQVDRDQQDAMLTTEETIDLACDFDQAVIRAARASHDDPGRLRPSRQ
jgi:hypothetical protein